MVEKLKLKFDECNTFEKYKGTEQLNLFEKVDNLVKSITKNDTLVKVKSEELPNNNLSVNLFKDGKLILNVDCRKDNIAIQCKDFDSYYEYVDKKIILDEIERVLERLLRKFDSTGNFDSKSEVRLDKDF